MRRTRVRLAREKGKQRYREEEIKAEDDRSDREREKKSMEGRDAGQAATARGWEWTQRVEERLPRESLVKWKSITSTLNHLNWFRHGPKARPPPLSFSLSRRVRMSNVR